MPKGISVLDLPEDLTPDAEGYVHVFDAVGNDYKVKLSNLPAPSNVSSGIPTITETETARTLTTGDAFKMIRFTNPSDITITVDDGVFFDGDEVYFEQTDAGKLVFDGTATLRVYEDYLPETDGRYAVIAIRFSSANSAVLVGQLKLA